MPSYKNHYDVLKTATIGDFQILSPADGHGLMHVQIGGLWGDCSDAYSQFSEKWRDVLANMTNKTVDENALDLI